MHPAQYNMQDARWLMYTFTGQDELRQHMEPAKHGPKSNFKVRPHKAQRSLPCQLSSIALPPAFAAEPRPLRGVRKAAGLASSRRRKGSGEGESPLSASHARRMGSALGSEQAGACARAPPAEARRMGNRRAPLARGTLRCRASYSHTSPCSARAGAQREEQSGTDA